MCILRPFRSPQVADGAVELPGIRYADGQSVEEPDGLMPFGLRQQLLQASRAVHAALEFGRRGVIQVIPLVASFQ